MDRYICIHGHFYQPPRENPWLEAVETQSSAYPYHDWNARITAECYAPNGASRIMDDAGKIETITNNYAGISFNFGPTLLTWLADNALETYATILYADKQSQERFGGHGSAIAQVYNHIIMPLANERDKYTQVRWGIRDFVERFGRQPEGMWLAETAVDIPTLEVLAECGIAFTILAPTQASRVRPLDGSDDDWEDVTGSHIDPSRAYRQMLPSGRSIDLFFYDGPISQAIAFEKLLSSGEKFAKRLGEAFSDDRDWPQLVHIATDGETYGHHFKHGDMALAYALQYIEEHDIAKVTNYGEFRELCPPTHEVQIIERTSWSCSHGVERWNSDCGCNSGGHAGWNQQWRHPLRVALDWLRDELAPTYETEAGKLFADPWATRDAYIDVILDRSEENVAAKLAEWAGRELSEDETITALQLLEMQRHLLLMYTSCGWFFDELSGLETVQVIMYAGRAVQLAERWRGPDLEAAFLDKLEDAKSNIPEHGDGKQIYLKWVKPTMISLNAVMAHYAMSGLFENYPEIAPIYAFTVERSAQEQHTAGKARLLTGKAQVRTHITHEHDTFSFAAMHFENHNLLAGVRHLRTDDEYGEMVHNLAEAFDRADIGETVRLLDTNFEQHIYTLNLLFRDEQIKILDIIVGDERREAEAINGGIYDRNVGLLRYLTNLHLGIPDVLKFAAEAALRGRLQAAIDRDPLNPDEVRQLLHEAGLSDVKLDTANLTYRMGQRLDAIIDAFRDNPDDAARLDHAVGGAALVHDIPGANDAEIWHAQNVYYDLMQRHGDEWRQRAATDDAARAWWEQIVKLGELLNVAVDSAVTAPAVAD